tara:strand:- start:5788 stop:6012 length:225 start_codon:yes stop_codon:yes gene_type:complete
MNLEFFILGGYGQYVWPAFVFSFVSCAVLFIKAKKELEIQEKIYLNKYAEPLAIKIETAGKKKTIKKVLSGSSI